MNWYELVLGFGIGILGIFIMLITLAVIAWIARAEGWIEW